uniref:RWD domain-containing protein 1 n=1 Tax=Aceria tosichella TaxID=561515 RepID=A0A6G1SGQ0_9ACAR
MNRRKIHHAVSRILSYLLSFLAFSLEVPPNIHSQCITITNCNRVIHSLSPCLAVRHRRTFFLSHPSVSMDYVEEQKNELEALSEIYYNEIEVKSNQQPISFSIRIRPQASYYERPEAVGDGDDGDSEESEPEPEADQVQCSFVKLLFELPPQYPETKPSIKLLNSENLEEHEVEELLKNLNDKSDELLGNVMIFELVSDVVEWLSTKAEREATRLAREQERKLELLEAEEKRKCDGTPVTVETFLAWKAKFDAELLKLKLEQQKKLSEQMPAGQKRLTGREMFETDKALIESDLNFVDDLEQDQLEALMQNIDEAELEDDDDDDNDDDDDYDSDDLDVDLEGVELSDDDDDGDDD